MDLADCANRDKANADRARSYARQKLEQPTHFKPRQNMSTGVQPDDLKLAAGLQASRDSLGVIADRPFDAMIEAEIATHTGSGRHLMYANERTGTNESLGVGAASVKVVAWTHPVVQLALSGSLEKERKVAAADFAIRSVVPLARARFQRVLPTLKGLYDPGGAYDEAGVEEIEEPRAGLKAVKLSMTSEQVDAFLARMDGILMISGAPGTGKTTVAIQRIRFLFDQQFENVKPLKVRYSPFSTRVFLANENLIDYTRDLLVTELDVPPESVSLVGDFIYTYVNDKWAYTYNARPRSRRIEHAEERSREAFFNLCKPSELSKVWLVLENQVLDRLGEAKRAQWLAIARAADPETAVLAETLADGLAVAVALSSDPLSSNLRMDAVYARVADAYNDCRAGFVQENRDLESQESLLKARDAFDDAFTRWLFGVYDPLDTLSRYFSERVPEGMDRIRAGTRELIRAEAIIDAIFKDWGESTFDRDRDPEETSVRQYGSEERSWIAWLLRFTLPESAQYFRGIPHAFVDGTRWTHVVIDEAQDLSVQEASFLSSLTDPRGALTVSADFHQVVSPVHGMDDADALKFGSSIKDAGTYPFPFNKNMRQSREIGRFLMAFYQVTFQEMAPFDAGHEGQGVKPALLTTSRDLFGRVIAQRMAVLAESRNVNSVAMLLLDDDPTVLRELRRELIDQGVALAPDGALQAEKGDLIVTSVEKAKGLEFDACIVLGLDDLERASLNHAKNRAYVALSRPILRLFVICEHFPPLFEGIPTDLYEHRQINA